jgi:hypothetical protein
MIPGQQPSQPAMLSSHNHDLTNRHAHVHSFVPKIVKEILGEIPHLRGKHQRSGGISADSKSP